MPEEELKKTLAALTFIDLYVRYTFRGRAIAGNAQCFPHQRIILIQEILFPAHSVKIKIDKRRNGMIEDLFMHPDKTVEEVAETHLLAELSEVPEEELKKTLQPLHSLQRI